MFALCALVLSESCSQAPPSSSSVQRLAALPAEVLISDPSQEWLGLALPLIIQEDLATSRSTAPFFAKDESGAYQGHATEVLRTVVEDRNGKLRLSTTTTDPQTQKNQRVIDVEADSATGILGAFNRLAKQIDAQAREFPTQSLAALKAFTSAVATQDLSRRLQLLSEAVNADGRFGLAHIALIETAAQAAPQSLPAIMAAGTARHDQFAPLERTRWNLLMARYSHAPLQQQADATAAVLKIAPNNIDALGTLGVDRFLQGSGKEGEQLLRQAIALSPENLNLQLQLANGFIEARRFRDAVAVLAPLSGNAAVLPALAVAKLLAGKTNEATTIFQGLVNLLPAGSTEANFLRAQWEAICAGKGTPSILSSTTETTHGYSAFLNGQFEEATQFWRSIVQQTGDTDLRARAMLAASLRSAGRTAEANKILVLPFVPDLRDAGVAIAFHQMRQILRL